LVTAFGVASLLVAACSKQNVAPSAGLAADAGSAQCPARAKVGTTLPNTTPALSELSTWLGFYSAAQLDEVLLDSEQLAAHDAALRRADESSLVVDLGRPLDSELVRRELYGRLTLWEERFRTGEHTLEQGDGLASLKQMQAHSFVEQRGLYVALAPIALRCAPMLGVLRAVHGDPRFDRNMCSQVRAQEPLEVLGQLGELRFVRSAYAIGFIPKDAPLSAQVPAQLEATYRRPEELLLRRDLTLDGVALKAGSVLVGAGEGRVLLASTKGVSPSRPLSPDEAQPGRRPLTRRAFLEQAFGYVGAPYGLGDEGGGRDCSRLVLDVLRGFGLHLPRSSAQQSQAGVYTVDVPSDASETERLGLLDQAVERGVVLLHFPGHIAFYLGRDPSGVPRLLHSFAEFLRSCPGGGETLVEVDRVAVSDLSLGKHTSRRAFLERMTRLTVFGKAPGQGLLGVSRFRTPVVPPQLPERCEESERAGLFVLPREPRSSRPLRVVAVSERELRPAGLWLFDPSGQRRDAAVHELGVGPFARWVELPEPTEGSWTALVADGERVLSCRRFKVRSARTLPSVEARGSVREPNMEARTPESPAWRERHSPSPALEALYAAFVEQLFAHPLDDMRSWSSLAELLQDPQRNLLHDYLGLDEDAKLTLKPDCADLPYFLRAYFSWKLGLPFAYRQCSRGRADAPPRCGPALRQTTPIEASDDVSAFASFIRKVSSGVHSASGRTLASDEATDLYPLPLTREALRPGSVFVDPYGHLIVVAQWVPQGWNGQGMLLGADAQPDASLGRRRFWRGNFLFSPDTSVVGAGFKGFRPLAPSNTKPTAPAAEGELPAGRYAELGASAPSLEQYEGSADSFYERMDALIYPRPIAVDARMNQLVSALEEQLKRRVEAIDLGEDHVQKHPGVVAMPSGFAIFETEGAWEDFATPSRDMRLLIAIDAVRAFPAQVKRNPERFLANQAQVDAATAALETLLAARSFRYTGSGGVTQELSLAQVMERAEALELGYNPNDCIEYRWGAPEGSDEQARCKRRAPAAQQREMERYRAWFHERARPARP
jgi:hypothetical protein